ncbi:S9 family peptidase [Alienimonas chondri]|uniref:Prolyl tripeptidyl peptidase n=1 Tax=Alienimonas chondri TaxID=2681879 RepID=A0ABX1VJ02_9PLAN|nr:DPP IV N-terminal domain-containing protein [Alienimonas chondri]NNJ27263.1 Prolyl tripeptidyl peptidase [Alienimonas chondri]
MISLRLAPVFALLLLAPAGQGQDERGAEDPKAAADLRPMRFEDVYGSANLDLTGSTPRGLEWLGPDRYLVPADQGSPQVVEAATGEARLAYDAAALSAALTDAGVKGDVAEKFSRRPVGATFDEERRRALLESEGDLFAVDFGGPAFGVDSDAAPLAVRLTDTPQTEELSELSPDGRTAAFVREFNLYTIPLIGVGEAMTAGPEAALTVGGGDLIRYGKADWVYFEELYNRSWKGYRWSPDSQRIAVMEYDDRAVGTFVVLDQTAATDIETRPDDSGQLVERTRYPKAGATNPTVRLGVVDATGGPIRWVDWSADGLPGLSSLGRTSGDGGGLIAHYGWFPEGDRLYGYVQDRVQSMLSVRAVDVPAEGPLGEATELLKETAGAWVESPGDLEFLPDGSFLLASTRDGWRHLYRYSPDGTLRNVVTSGPWEVRDLNQVAVSDAPAAEAWIYLTGTKDDPLGEFLYRVRPDGSGLTRLTPEDGVHRASVAPGGGFFIDAYSAHDTPPRTLLRRGDGELVRTLDEADPEGLTKTARGTFAWVQIPVAAAPRADGGMDPAGTLYGYLLTPPGLNLANPDRRVPVWVMTYGGPHASSVKDEWAKGRGWERLLATNGIAVLKIDPRAASARGWAAAWAVHGRLGEQETTDMAAVADWLKAQPWCDGDRLGLSGHSYGGYMTARVLTHTNKYAAGIAGGSVTDFRNYDTIYTERLMDTPAANPGGYDQTNLSSKASDLHGRLLLIHGGMDDNVHPQNAWQFVDALQRRGKDFDLMIYPRDRHSISSTHYRRLMWDFIRETMLEDSSRSRHGGASPPASAQDETDEKSP